MRGENIARWPSHFLFFFFFLMSRDKAHSAVQQAARRRRPTGGEHQRHRAKLAQVLHTPTATGVFMSCARGKERKAARELADVLREVRTGLLM